ncbi:MAG: PAS domain-containing sensor histidine kinase [Acidimicrobiales bacterium]
MSATGLGPVERPPWARSTFWLLQLVVLALDLASVAGTLAFHLSAGSAVTELSTFVLFAIPVAVAALDFGLGGALVTVGWIALLAVPRLVSFSNAGDHTAAWVEVVQIILLASLGSLVGQRISNDTTARRVAEVAHEAHLNAEARYRDLFDTNQAPILIVDGNGSVIEANRSARGLFRSPPESPGPQHRPRGVEDHRATRLVDMIGPEAAAEVLSELVDALSRGSGRHDPITAQAEVVRPISVDVAGQPGLFRPAVTPFGSDGTVQVVFEDVTAETRRRDRVEAYAARVVTGQEEERRRIAQELHDGPVQALVHLCRQLDSVEVGSRVDSWRTPEAIDTTHASDSPTLSDLRVTVEDTVAELRSIARGLRPSILDDLGLVASANQLLADLGARCRIETTFDVSGTERRLSPVAELTLFRITQEALSNVERHSNARRASVRLDFSDSSVRLRVDDDGEGFAIASAASAVTGRTLGILGMSERANLIGADLVIDSNPGLGTSVEVSITSTESVAFEPNCS